MTTSTSSSRGTAARQILSFGVRAAITALAFWWIFRKIDCTSLWKTFLGADKLWLLLGLALFFISQFVLVVRWQLLVPAHPRLTFPFLVNSYFVGCFFSAFLPTTVGGDIVRSYDLIKATGQWRESLASVLVDRLVGMLTLLLFALIAWGVFPPVRQDPVIRMGFAAFCLFVLASFGILGSRRVLHASLKPFGRIGLGQLQVHAKQFQESALAYLKRPGVLVKALGISFVAQLLVILMSAAVSQALGLSIPVVAFFLILPLVAAVSQLPISLNGWGIREMTTVHILQRLGIDPTKALSLSLIGSILIVLGGATGGILFLARQRRKSSR